ncbi:SpaA isopeptide-forming pilin-related protein, partial [Peptostreptococcus sp. MV1]|uniref:SpaA isopeptide-forming pilin-related protein n=1 Tax=Peptostreptococcus sp. MV1 TaxID=1219626 RepID=UPI0005637A49
GNKKLEDGTLVMVDAYKKAPEPGTKTTKVNFSKRALTRDGKELSGAKISLTKKDGTVVDTWVTDGTTRSFDLEDGEYTFTELSAPDKYQLATSITFTVANGKVSVGTTEISGNTIVMVDALKDKETNGSNGGNRSNNSSGNSNSGNSSQGKQTQQGYSGNSSQGKQTQQGYNNTQSSRGPAKTNDISNFMLYVGMLILSGLGLVLLSIKRRTTR